MDGVADFGDSMMQAAPLGLAHGKVFGATRCSLRRSCSSFVKKAQPQIAFVAMSKNARERWGDTRNAGIVTESYPVASNS
jgi:hypothetical protein